MKIYFSIAAAEKHKFTDPLYERYLVLDFKKLWFASRSRAVCYELKNGTVIDPDTGIEYITDYYTVVFEHKTYLRIRLNDLKNSYWCLRGFIDARIPKNLI